MRSCALRAQSTMTGSVQDALGAVSGRSLSVGLAYVKGPRTRGGGMVLVLGRVSLMSSVHCRLASSGGSAPFLLLVLSLYDIGAVVHDRLAHLGPDAPHHKLLRLGRGQRRFRDTSETLPRHF